MRVIKLGGSLLDHSELRNQLSRFLDQLTPPSPSLIVVGGGDLVEAVRGYDKIFSMDSKDCHWLCTQLMDTTAKLLHLIFPHWQYLATQQALDRWIQDASSQVLLPEACPEHPPTIVAASAYYSPSLNADSLPMSWATTGDSISALLAGLVHASELILLKSASADLLVDYQFHSDTPRGSLPIDLAVDGSSGSEKGLLDEAFFRCLPGGLTVRLVNLRTWQMAE